MLYYDGTDVSKGLILIRQVHQKRVLFATIGILLDNRLTFQPDIFDVFQDILMMPMNFSTFATLKIHGVDYCCINNGINQTEAIVLLQNDDLSKKGASLENKMFLYRVSKMGKAIIILVYIKIEKHKLY